MITESILQKFGRIYNCTIDIPNATSIISLTIDFPLTCEFVIERSVTLKLNTARLKFYNLKQDTRELIYKDRFHLVPKKIITFNAGYQTNANIPTIFKGEILEAYQEKHGTDIITNILASDGGISIQGAFINTTLKQGMTGIDMLRNFATNLGLPTGYVGDLSNYSTGSGGRSLSGNTFDAMQKTFDNTIFIDNSVINKLSETEAINQTLIINSENGLKGIPRKQGMYLMVDMLFEPRIKPGMLANLTSQHESIYNGVYKIVGFTSSGTISNGVMGDCTTTVQLFASVGKTYQYVNKI